MWPLRGERARGSATRGITSVMFADAGEMVSRPERAPSAGAGKASLKADQGMIEKGKRSDGQSKSPENEPW